MFLKKIKKRLSLEDQENIIGYTFIFLVAVLPFAMILAPIAMVIFVLTVLWLRTHTGFWDLKRNQYFLPFYFYYLFAVIGLFYSFELGIEYRRIASQLPMFLLPFCISLAQIREKDLTQAKKVFVWSCFAFCIFGFLSLFYQFIVNHEHRFNYNFVQRSIYHFHYPYDSLYINIAYVFLLTETSLKKHMDWISAAFLIFIFLSGVRMGIFTFLLISFIYFLRNYKTILTRVFFLKAFVVLFFAFIGINSSQYTKDKLLDTLSSLGIGTSVYVSDIGERYHQISLRTKMWESSVDLIKEKPILGFGPNGSQSFLEEQYLKKGYVGLFGLNSHNQFLTTALNHGLIGLLLLLSIFFAAGYMVFRNRDIQGMLCIIVLFLAFLTESVLVRQKGVFLFAIVISIFALASSKKKISQKD